MTIRLTNEDHRALIKAALAARDRQWEDCLKTLDEKPPLVPDPDWFRTWSERVGLTHNELTDEAELEVRTDGAKGVVGCIEYVFRKAHSNGQREWTFDEIVTLITKELDDYNAQE